MPLSNQHTKTPSISGCFFLCILIFLSLFRPNVGVPSETFRFHRSKMIHTLLYHRFKVNAQILDVKISVYIHIYFLYIYVWKSYSLFGSCILPWMHLTREKWSFFFLSWFCCFFVCSFLIFTYCELRLRLSLSIHICYLILSIVIVVDAVFILMSQCANGFLKREKYSFFPKNRPKIAPTLCAIASAHIELNGTVQYSTHYSHGI